MTYYEIVKKILDTARKHILVNEVGDGDIYEYLNSGSHKYPCVFFTEQNITDNDEHQTLNATLFYVDRNLEDRSNKEQIQSVGMKVIKQILKKLQEDNAEIEIKSSTFTTFEEKFADYCAGVFTQFQLSYSNDVQCEEDLFADDFDYFYFEALEDSTVGFTSNITPEQYIPRFKYSFDKINWINWNYSTINLNEGTKVYFRGKNLLFSLSNVDYSHFTSTGKVKIGGRLLSLVNDNSENNNIIPYEPEPTIFANNEFCRAFEYNDAIYDASELVMPDNIDVGCYREMFRGCSSLVTAPALPATTLADWCYYYMFSGCSNLSYIKCFATDISANNCTYKWVNKVAADGTFVKKAGVEWTVGSGGIPNGWTIIEE